jgi:hypothetical protein
MSKQSKRIKPNAPSMIKAGPGQAMNMPAGGQPPGVPYDFTKVHIHFGIPCYGGQITEPCFTSFLRFILMASRSGLQWSLDTMVNESLVTRARNNLMAKMMTNTAATHFMFIDADIRFQPEAVFMMLAADKDVIGGLYPKKALPVQYVINVKPGTMIQNDIFPVDTMGTGFMMFKRHVYEKLCVAHPECKYVDDVGLGKQYEPTMFSIFDTEIDEKGHYLSEDWTFCRRWAKIGGEIYAHAKVLLNHSGHYEFAGDLSVLTGGKPTMPDITPAQMEAKAAQEAQPQ